MTANTVLLNVQTYNDLRDFFIGINEGKYVVINSYSGTIYYAKEKEVLKTLKNKIDKLQNKLNTLKNHNEKTIDEVKKMSLFQFLKWRNTCS